MAKVINLNFEADLRSFITQIAGARDGMRSLGLSTKEVATLMRETIKELNSQGKHLDEGRKHAHGMADGIAHLTKEMAHTAAGLLGLHEIVELLKAGAEYADKGAEGVERQVDAAKKLAGLTRSPVELGALRAAARSTAVTEGLSIDTTQRIYAAAKQSGDVAGAPALARAQSLLGYDAQQIIGGFAKTKESFSGEQLGLENFANRLQATQEISREGGAAGVGVEELLPGLEKLGPEAEAAGLSSAELMSLYAQFAKRTNARTAAKYVKALLQEINKDRTTRTGTEVNEVDATGKVTGKKFIHAGEKHSYRGQGLAALNVISETEGEGSAAMGIYRKVGDDVAAGAARITAEGAAGKALPRAERVALTQSDIAQDYETRRAVVGADLMEEEGFGSSGQRWKKAIAEYKSAAIAAQMGAAGAQAQISVFTGERYILGDEIAIATIESKTAELRNYKASGGRGPLGLLLHNAYNEGGFENQPTSGSVTNDISHEYHEEGIKAAKQSGNDALVEALERNTHATKENSAHEKKGYLRHPNAELYEGKNVYGVLPSLFGAFPG